jgi:hypothetical protein
MNYDANQETGSEDELELFAEVAFSATGAEPEAGDEEDNAWELLSVQSEAELEAFLGKLFRTARRAATPMLGKLLRGGAKSLLKKALPMIGGLAGSIIPGAGNLVGAAAGSALSQLIGNEAEAMSEPEGQMEVARRLVRTIGDATNRVAADPAAAANPRAAVAGAFRTSMQRHVPGLLPARGRGTSSGRWIRRGDTIVLLGA